MREFKFRAWDEEESKMIEWYDEFFSDMSPVTRCSSYFSFIDMELMQYTGLKDKNGCEIFEGDIVNVREAGHPFVNDWKGIVKMIDGCYLIENFKGTNGEFLYDEIRETEIIGNIYENKEL